mgnify:CR=1 FL=1
MITLALSKGRIFDETLPLLKAAGIEVLEDPETSRKLILPTNQPGVRVVLLNWFRSVNTSLVKQLAAAGACFDIATLENVGGVANLMQQIPVERK